MATTFKCQYCGQENEITKAFTKQIEAQIIEAESKKHELELAKVRKEAEEAVAQKVSSEFEFELKKLKAAESQSQERNIEFQNQIMALTKELRTAKQAKEEVQLEMQKKLLEEEEKIRFEARKKAIEEHQLKDLEKDKKLQDALKQVEELRTKIEQGSQQTQGEVLELALEQILKQQFPQDSISEVKKGVRGADILEEVVDKTGKNCGRILWESKNAQWSQTWIGKLKEDMRQAKAHVAVLVCSNLPDDCDTFVYKEGIWLTSRQMVIPLALTLRYYLIRVDFERRTNQGKNEKMEILYDYVTSMEFKHRIEAIVEVFNDFQTEMEREKRWFQTKWSRQEKQLRKVLDHTHGMYGDLQGVVGKSLPELTQLSLPDAEIGDSNKELS